jgi:hypothetical protein
MKNTIIKYSEGNPYSDASLSIFKWGAKHYKNRFISLFLLLIICGIIDIATKEFFSSIFSIMVFVLLTIQYAYTYYTYVDIAVKWENNYGKRK